MVYKVHTLKFVPCSDI